MANSRIKGIFKKVIMALAGLMAAVVIFVAVVNIVVVGSTRSSIISADEASTYQADAIVVLGASVFEDGTPSGILQDRLDGAIELYFAGAAPCIIMSGDNGTASYNECWAMKRYALSKGVPSDVIFCDHAGFCTYDSMYRAQYIFGCKRIIVSTQSYHLYRALYIAQGLGMEAVGVATDYNTYDNQLYYDVREMLARVKDAYQVLVRAPAEVLGDAISLNQSGNVTD